MTISNADDNQKINNSSASSISLVFRALLKEQYLNRSTWEVDPEAFVCRPRNDFKGLSVGFTCEDCLKPFLESGRWYGTASLLKAAIEDLLLSIEADGREGHAEIQGIPRYETHRFEDTLRDQYGDNRLYEKYKLAEKSLIYDTAKAEFYARKLSAIAKIIFVNHKKRKQ